MSVKNRSTEREAVLAGIQKCRDFVRGEDAIKSKKKDYLLEFYPNQDAAAYKLYLKEAESVGVSTAMHQSLLGALTRREPTVTLPKNAEWIKDSFGDRGQGLLLWMVESLDQQIATSNDWVFIDMPKTEGRVSVKDKEDNFLRPYPIHIQAEQLLDTRKTMQGSKEVLTDFRYLTKFEEETSPFTYEEKEMVTHLYLDKEGNAVRDDYVNEKITNSSTFIINGKPMKVLPVFSLNGRIVPMQPMIKPVVDVDAHLYNKQSRWNHYNYILNTSTIITSGVSDKDQENLGALGGIWHLGDPQAKAYTLGVDAEVVRSSEMAINQGKASAASLGARMFADGKIQVESAEALAIKNASSHASLSQTANVFSSVIEDILTFVIYWDTGTEPKAEEVIVEISKDFIPVALNGQDLTALVSARLQNVITDEEFFDAMKRGEIIGDSVDYEEHKSQLEAEVVVEPDPSGPTDPGL